MSQSADPGQYPAVACIVVNWNNFADTDACLNSLAAQDYPNLQVTVVDNGSADSSLSRLRLAHPWASYVPLPENAGFSRACNAGARHPAAAADFLWLLNNDTIVPPDTAAKLVAAALTDPQAGVVGAVLYYMDRPSTIQAWGGGSVSRWTGYNRHYTTPTALGRGSYITFASALIRRQTFDQLHGLYEGAFMYFEDSDFCLRARAFGWHLAVASGTAILHKEGGTADADTGASPQKDRMITTAGLLFLERHAPIPALAYTIFVVARLSKRMLRLDLPALAAVLRGTRDWLRRTR